MKMKGTCKMKQKGSAKRLIILALALLGLVIYTSFYAYMWSHYFYNQIFCIIHFLHKKLLNNHT